MELSGILTSLMTLAIMGVAIYYIIKYYDVSDTSTNPLKTIPISTIYDGRKEMTYSDSLPKSFNQSDGIGLSYAGWIRVDDFTYRYGTQKVIFSKGQQDGTHACPAMMLDANTNSILVKVDTYGQPEIVSVQNIPAKKWVHFAIVIDQDSVDVYINGTLSSHHTLVNLPKQNTSSLYISPQGGFDGKIGLLEYFNYALKPSDIPALASVSPSPDPSDSGIGPTPPYFDSSWWTGRR
jgi:hypothetical protein